MATPKKAKEDLLKVGRKTDYDEAYNEMAFKLSLLGATDKEIAGFFEVSETTINNWKINFPKFFESIKEGKLKADMEIAHSLYKSAIDREIEEEQLVKYKIGPNKEKYQVIKVKKAIPADFRSIQFWLRNRKSDVWKDKQELSIDDKSVEVIKKIIGGKD